MNHVRCKICDKCFGIHMHARSAKSHAVCNLCLELWIAGYVTGETLPCPVCGEEITHAKINPNVYGLVDRKNARISFAARIKIGKSRRLDRTFNVVMGVFFASILVVLMLPYIVARWHS